MRYFTAEELLKESRPLADLALEALDAGQIQQLHCLLNEMDQVTQVSVYWDLSG